MRYFVFNEEDSRDYGYILDIERSILPALEPIQITIPRRAGAYIPKKRSREIGTNGFSVKFGVLGGSRADFRSEARRLAKWLFNANKNGEAARLWFSDEPARIYLAWIDGSTDLEEFEATGEVTINFICPDPFANSTSINTTLFDVGNAKNLVPLGYHDFEAMAAGTFTSISTIDTEHARSGTKALKIGMRAENNNAAYLSAGSTDYNIPVTGGQRYIFSWHAYSEAPANTQGHVAFNTAETQKLYSSGTFANASGEWNRYFVEVTAPADATLAVVRVDCDTSWADMWFDDLQFEVATTGQTLPSAYKAPEAVSVKVQIRNSGTMDTYPDFRIVPTADLLYLRLSDGEGNHILLNNRTFPAWSNIIIDNKKGEVYWEASGTSLMSNLTIDSRFFKLEPEKDYILTLETNSTGGMSARVNWQEKFL
jgi:predicted phage tail component-like protein